MSEWKPCRKKPLTVHFREIGPREPPVFDSGTNTWSDPETHYLMKGVDGEVYPITKAIFHKTYDVLGAFHDVEKHYQEELE